MELTQFILQQRTMEEGMKKKVSALALAGMLMAPGFASANGSDITDLEKKINEMSRQLVELKEALAAQAEEQRATKEQVTSIEDTVIDLDYRADDWDFASRVKFGGDFRTRMDAYSAESVLGRDYDNDTLWTNRFRLNMGVKATENVDVNVRLAMYKAWGMQSAFQDDSGAIWPDFDGNATRKPSDSALYVDRAIANWNNIGGLPVWFSIGRRPTTDGPPAQLRMGMEKRMATPVAFMDWPFDGLTLGYRYDWGNDTFSAGKLRFCYGRGFENGLQDSTNLLNDTDFAGLSWDVFNNNEEFLYIQSFMAFNLFNYPNFRDPIIDANFGALSGMGERETAGNLLHTSTIYQGKVSVLNYFLAGGWSQTRPDQNGLFNDFVGMNIGTTGPNTDNENGYSAYGGIRYDIDDIGLKLGLEYNWGSQYWIGMTPGHDDIYQSKLAARGSVYEVYAIYDLPTGKALSKYAKTFMRIGYQHYDYDYSGSGDWNMIPYDLDDPAEVMKLAMAGQDATESADQIYVTFEVLF
jgi:hypothetical protein